MRKTFFDVFKDVRFGPAEERIYASLGIDVSLFQADSISFFCGSGDGKNHFPVFFCNLHSVEHINLLFENQSADVFVETDSLGSGQLLEPVLFTLGNKEVDSGKVYF